MMSVMRVAISLLFTLAACGETGRSNETVAIPASAQLGLEHVLGFAETLRLVDGLALEFTSLTRDSRCPTGVTCVWAGNARIHVTATTAAGTAVLELNTNSRFATTASYDGFRVELRRLDPYPNAEPPPGTISPPPPTAYKATLFIDRVAPK
ncbi:MAG: hypothetical protein ABI821_12960 [Pseudomonadota bacterium]